MKFLGNTGQSTHYMMNTWTKQRVKIDENPDNCIMKLHLTPWAAVGGNTYLTIIVRQKP